MNPLGPTRSINQPKRRYTSRACEGCRRRRAKCNGARPSCTRCVSRGQVCSYSAEEDGRRPAPRSYVELLRGRINTLEEILRMHSIDVDEAVAAVKAKDKPFLESGLAGEKLGSGERTDTDITSCNVEELCATFEGALSLDESLNYEQDGEIRYFGSTSGRLDFRCDSNYALQDARSLRASNQRAEMNSRILSSQEHDVSEELKSHLTGLYFTWQQPWCQVVDENLFRKSSKTQGRYYSPLLENCILALGSRFSDKLEIRSDPDDCNTAGRLFLEKAEVLLPFDLKWPNITTIQSLSLMCSLYVSIGADAAGWLYQGMASRLALDMGFNLDASSLIGSNLISAEEAELRRQIYWSLYCDDKLSAAYTGRVCTTLDCQGSVKLPSISSAVEHEMFGEENRVTHKRRLVLLHHKLISLSQIMEKIITSLYAPKPRCEGSVQRISFFESCALELKTWFYSLPSEMSLEKSETLPQVYILHMVYHTSLILLAKPFLSKFHDQATMNMHQGQATTNNDILEKARVMSFTAAKQICVVSKKYQQAFGSFRRSPITATHCNLSAALVLINSEGAAPASTNGITTCLEVLDQLSVSWNTAYRIRANLLKLIEKHPNPHSKTTSKSISTSEDNNAKDQVTSNSNPDLENGLSFLDGDQSNDLTITAWMDPGFDLTLESLPYDYDIFSDLNRAHLDSNWEWS